MDRPTKVYLGSNETAPDYCIELTRTARKAVQRPLRNPPILGAGTALKASDVHKVRRDFENTPVSGLRFKRPTPRVVPSVRCLLESLFFEHPMLEAKQTDADSEWSVL